MTHEQLLFTLEYWADCLENPTYCPLEVGFRHRPLTKDEMIQRYKDECAHTRDAILRTVEILKRDGITTDMSEVVENSRTRLEGLPPEPQTPIARG